MPPPSWGLATGIRRSWKLERLIGLNAEILALLLFYFALFRSLPWSAISDVSKSKKEHLSQQETVMRKPSQQWQPHEEVTLHHFWTGIEMNKAASNCYCKLKKHSEEANDVCGIRWVHFKAGLHLEISSANFSARQLFGLGFWFWGFFFYYFVYISVSHPYLFTY